MEESPKNVFLLIKTVTIDSKMMEQEFFVYQIQLFAMKDIKMMEEDFLNVFNYRLHVSKATKTMDFRLFVFIVAKIVILDLKIMVLELNVSQLMLNALKDTKMMED